MTYCKEKNGYYIIKQWPQLEHLKPTRLRHVIFGIFDNFKAKLEFNHSIGLVHTVPVYAPVRPGSLQHADPREPGRIGTKLTYRHTVTLIDYWPIRNADFI